MQNWIGATTTTHSYPFPPKWKRCKPPSKILLEIGEICIPNWSVPRENCGSALKSTRLLLHVPRQSNEFHTLKSFLHFAALFCEHKFLFSPTTLFSFRFKWSVCIPHRRRPNIPNETADENIKSRLEFTLQIVSFRAQSFLRAVWGPFQVTPPSRTPLQNLSKSEEKSYSYVFSQGDLAQIFWHSVTVE